MTYVYLGQEHGREVLAQLDNGSWVPGLMEATMFVDTGWRGQVRYLDAEGRSHLEWFDEGRIKNGRDGRGTTKFNT